ncbi:hypothetical protein Nepgr_016805 [Nepenthes gracilis]|uniref:C3H1-type domain-containing protein n=1 Tax=Nepenthes gracilis TaxID=150966 RepID=A0AAD3SQC7_NEPGR|nr:hypothetical protein Nepgr_016805 [Nepenthes gracilis]
MDRFAGVHGGLISVPLDMGLWREIHRQKNYKYLSLIKDIVAMAEKKQVTLAISFDHFLGFPNSGSIRLLTTQHLFCYEAVKMREIGKKRNSKWDVAEVGTSSQDAFDRTHRTKMRRHSHDKDVAGCHLPNDAATDNPSNLPKHDTGMHSWEARSGGREFHREESIHYMDREGNGTTEMPPPLVEQSHENRSHSHKNSSVSHRSWSISLSCKFHRESGSNNRRRNRSGVSTQFCRYFSAGRCRKGSRCQFLHHDSESYDSWHSENCVAESLECRKTKGGASRYSSDDCPISTANVSQFTAAAAPTDTAVHDEQQLTQASDVSPVAQLLENKQQLSQLYAALVPHNTMEGVSSLPKARASIPPASSTAFQSNEADESNQYDPKWASDQEGPVAVSKIEGNGEAIYCERSNLQKNVPLQGKDNYLMWIRPFKFALAEFVKELLIPTWKHGELSREIYKTIAKKVVDKVIASVHEAHVPQTREQIDQFLSFSTTKLNQFVQAYVEKYQTR